MKRIKSTTIKYVCINSKPNMTVFEITNNGGANPPHPTCGTLIVNDKKYNISPNPSTVADDDKFIMTYWVSIME